MANTPEDLSYTKDHEWVRVKAENATVGITDHAQHQLGDVVYVELPKVGDSFEAAEPFGSVESVKAVSEVYMPVGGTVVEVNESLNDSPEKVNQDPYGSGWMIIIKMEKPSQVDALLTAIEYEDYIKEEASE
ncbi:MAG TPA: glycine cleavage system protein GcvH [Blastocatellia bacterium]|jgi:glycine cleavage system H protein|nr:glycine cleavage system protein GcvH [Blastocatellia bacterium]